MTSWKKYMLAAVIVTAAVFAYNRNLHRSVPSDFRDAAGDTAIRDLKGMNSAKGGTGGVPTPIKPAGNTAKVFLLTPPNGVPTKPVEWVTLSGGEFMMGADQGGYYLAPEPIHKVTIKTFEMSKTEVTVEQYAECVINHACTEPSRGNKCNWGLAGRQLHPVNCVTWDQAKQYTRFINKKLGFEGARLPSESEWEYAARSLGRDQKYPWGNDEPTCDKAVMEGNNGISGCGTGGTMPVCSKTAGNTAQGLCDMAGNVWEWLQDKHLESYNGTPVDGSAYDGPVGVNGRGRLDRVMRGGGFTSGDVRNLQTTGRHYGNIGSYNSDTDGFRIARSIR